MPENTKNLNNDFEKITDNLYVIKFFPKTAETVALNYLLLTKKGNFIFAGCHAINENGYKFIKKKGKVNGVFVSHHHEVVKDIHVALKKIKSNLYIGEKDFNTCKKKVQDPSGLRKLEELSWDDLPFEVIKAPGHTAGFHFFVYREKGKTYLFSGDFMVVSEEGISAWHLKKKQEDDILNNIKILKKMKIDYILPIFTKGDMSLPIALSSKDKNGFLKAVAAEIRDM